MPEALVEARARELWDQMVHSLSHQGISKEAYLQIAGRTRGAGRRQARPDAEQALRREAVLAAVVEAERIEPTDGEVLDALERAAARESPTPRRCSSACARGRPPRRAARRTSRSAQALELLAEHANAISVEQAKARDKLWTPGSERADEGSPELWTPGS